MAEKVGFIGLGIMGKPMAKNLIEAGYELVLFNRTREKAEELADDGAASVAGNPREVAESSEIVVTMLPRTRRRCARSSSERAACWRAWEKALCWWT